MRNMATKVKPSSGKRLRAKSGASTRKKLVAVHAVSPEAVEAAPGVDSKPNVAADVPVLVSAPIVELVPKVELEVQTTKEGPAEAQSPIVDAPVIDVLPSLQVVTAPVQTVVVAASDPVAASIPSTPSETVRTIQGPMGPMQLVTRQVDGKTVQLLRIRKSEVKKKQRTSTKKLLLAAIPGFFGLMGLSQFAEGKKVKGAAFFVAGAAASFLSSWYVILPTRIEAALTNGVNLPPYALSFLSSLNIDSSLAAKLSVDLMGVVAVLWGLQLFDAMGPFVSRQTMAAITSAAGQKVSVPLPTMRRAIVPAPGKSYSPATDQKVNA